MHFLFTYLISFNNVFFNLRTNKHSIIMANGGLDNICTKIYTLLCYTCMLKKMYTFRENYFCKHLYAFRHSTMSYNNKDYYYFTKRAKLDYNEPIYINSETADSQTLLSSLRNKRFPISNLAIGKLLI